MWVRTSVRSHSSVVASYYTSFRLLTWSGMGVMGGGGGGGEGGRIMTAWKKIKG